MKNRESHEPIAFCMTCPHPAEVTTVMQSLDLRLTFQMDAILSPAYSQTADLPAQYHYRHRDGTEVIYLSGQDVPMNGVSFPPHASRWWLVAGSNPSVSRQVVDTLGALWQLSWQPMGRDEVCDESHAA